MHLPAAYDSHTGDIRDDREHKTDARKLPNLNNCTFVRIVQEWLESGLRYANSKTLCRYDFGVSNLKILNIEKRQKNTNCSTRSSFGDPSVILRTWNNCKKSFKGRKIAKHESRTKARVSPQMLRGNNG